MRETGRKIIRKLGSGQFAREIRRCGYRLFDVIGSMYFAILRLSGVLSTSRNIDRDKIAKILIIRTDRIGDLILSTPAIKAARSGFPRAEIHLLVAEYTEVLVINNPNVDRLLIYGKDMIERDYDLAIALHPGINQNRLTFKSGAMWRVGYTGRGGGFYLTHKIKDGRAKRIRHEVESALEVVGVAGCKAADTNLDLSVMEEGERFAELFFQEHDLDSNEVALIHPGARQEHIRWKKEGFAEVADKLIDQGTCVILIGGKNEGQLVEETEAFMKRRPVCALNLSLIQLISLIKRSDVFIGNSTGTMHIAAALRVPVVAIFGNTHPLDCYEEWGPWGNGHIVVSKDLDCQECHPSDCESFDCMKSISAQDVFVAAQKQLSKSVKEESFAGQMV